MSKMRIYELARELDMSSKDLISKISEELNMEVNSHMSTLSEEDALLIQELFVEEEPEKKEEIKEVKNIEKVKEKIVEEVKKVEKTVETIKEEVKAEVVKKEEENDEKESKKGKDKKKKKKKSKGVKDNMSKEKDIITEDLGNDVIEIDEEVVVRDFAELLGINTSKIISKLIELGMMVNQNQTIDSEIAMIVGEEFGFKVQVKEAGSGEITEDDLQQMEEEFDLDFEDEEKDLKVRPPVVTVMGHVDHGKTSLLDAIKESSVTKSEAGGITQHIGAYSVSVGDGKKIAFLDTPGHEAFTSMRMRGAQITDIAILVVAADDGVMPQTIEAISHAKAAGVPIIVAINKMDKPEANPDRIKQELLDNGLMPEDWGGDTITVPVSAKQREGIDELLEMVLLVAEMQELRANPNRNAVGTIIEAQLDKGKGPMATVLVQKGTLKVGDTIVSGTASGRIRAMFDDKGKRVKKAGPSVPVVVLGLSEVPNSGELLYAAENEKTARAYADKRRNQIREVELKSDHKVSLDDLFEQIKQGDIKDLNIIIKGDVKGSIEALKQSLEKLDTDEVKVNVIHGGVGGIAETDIMLASASNAIVIGFNVRPNLNAMEVAKKEKVDIRTYRVIYEAIEDIEAAIKGMHAPKIVEEVIGRAEVRATFRLPNGHSIAGIYVLDGKIMRNGKVRLLRDDVVIFEGGISSLKRFKDDAKEVMTGYEAGLGLDNYNDVKEGDIMEAYILKEVER